MFLSRGGVIETVRASVKTLRSILSSYIGNRFTGRITYRYPAEGIFISIEMVNGLLIACRGVALGALYEGASCCEVAVKYLDRLEGSIEVVEISVDAIMNDIIVFPSSKIEGETELNRQLTVMAPTAELAKEVKEPSIPPPKYGVGTVSNECIDPIQLYSILKTSQLIFQTINFLHHTDIEKIVSELRSRNPSYIYISSTVDGGTLRILIDVTNNIGYYQLEVENTTICGEEAHRRYLKENLLNVKIWIV